MQRGPSLLNLLKRSGAEALPITLYVVGLPVLMRSGVASHVHRSGTVAWQLLLGAPAACMLQLAHARTVPAHISISKLCESALKPPCGQVINAHP